MVIADGLDDALIGISSNDIAVYDIDKIIEILMTRDGMTDEEALEFFYFNIDGSYVGEQTPIYIHLNQGDDYAA